MRQARAWLKMLAFSLLLGWPANLIAVPVEADTIVKDFKIMLRTQYAVQGGKRISDDKVREWILRVPRGYVYRQGGLNGTVSGRGDLRHEGYLVKLHFIYDPETQKFHTWKEAPELPKRFSKLMITLWNRPGRPDKVHQPFCSNEVAPLCRDHSARCDVYTHQDGWTIEMSLERWMYLDPDKFCQKTLEFLNQYTTRRDSLLVAQVEKPADESGVWRSWWGKKQ